MAEAIFAHMVEEEGLSDKFIIDSCGTGSWHIGTDPHEGTLNILRERKIPLLNSKARQFSRTDFSHFDHIVTMDTSNLEDVLSLGGDEEQVYRLREYDEVEDDPDVPDPYYVGGFDKVYDIIWRSCENLLKELKKAR